MSETGVIKIVAAEGTGIPRTLKTYRSINVQPQPNGRGKVISVAVPQNIILGKSLSQPSLEQSSRSVEHVGDVPLSENSILSRGNRRKRKQYGASLESNLSAAKIDDGAQSQLKERNETIGGFEQEVAHLKSVLGNAGEISGLLFTMRHSNPLTITPSSDPPAKKMKLDCLSESSGYCCSLFDDADFDLSEWLPSTFQDLIWDADPSTDLHSCELPFLDPLPSSKFNRAGACFDVLDKKISLELCSSCSSEALENWAMQA
jgi:hypothetical protein